MGPHPLAPSPTPSLPPGEGETARIDYVSPLPPVRSGISDYSVDLLPHLATRADVRLIHLPGQPVAPEVAARWPLVEAVETGHDAQGPRIPLYQMGNNRYHDGVVDLALRLPGVLTLHDVVLHHLLLDVTLGRGLFAPYVERLTRDHGWVGHAAAVIKRWGAYGDAAVFALPAHRTLLRRQRGVLVHSRWAAELIAEEDPAIRVRAIDMGIPLPPPADPEAGRRLRRRFGLPEGAPVLGSFGFQTPIKRTAAVVRALAAPGLERVHLLVVGEVSPAVDLVGEARRAGVADRVHLTDFLPYEDFEASIAAVDLCLNLRYPTAGETSASLLRVMALGRPAVVSDYAQFTDLPETVALRVPLGEEGTDDEPAALAACLRELLAHPERLRAMGAAAREHVRTRHDPERSADAVIAAVREWQDLAPPGDLGEAPEIPSPSSLAWGKLDGEMDVAGAELPWPEGERRTLRIRLRNRGFARWLAGERGPGGVAVVVKLFVDGEDLLANRRWLALPRDLAPGEEAVFEADVRRPPGPPGSAHLWIEPHLFGGLGISKYGGPRWERYL
ncbi:MAG TPA: glycosyltransferase family 4 protein [Thermoanaerobaculia bacterium]|nr:glycosyltransferase family 4 protein [Thermoanaerobaculia bacterium]